MFEPARDETQTSAALRFQFGTLNLNHQPACDPLNQKRRSNHSRFDFPIWNLKPNTP